MHSTGILSVSALLALANAHGVILNAQGNSGSPASVGFQVDLNIPRNCTSISPCQQDTTIIRDAEIAANVVNECGRTELTGNIDVGENTENALAANAVTQVQSGSQITVTIHQVNADGAGPYTCDLDETSNAGIISQNLTVTNNVPGANGLSQAKEQDFNITVTMPDSLNCTGASTGNICTVRCRNNAVAGPFGGCFAVQQVDTVAKVNTAANIGTAATLADVEKQVLQDKQDLSAALAANANAGTDQAKANVDIVNSILGISVTTKASAVQTPEAAAGNAAAAADTTSAASADASATSTSSAATATSTKKSKSGKNSNNNSNANANGDGNGNTNNANTGGDSNAASTRRQRVRREEFRGNLRWAKRLGFAQEDSS